jgi:hypothetical protein
MSSQIWKLANGETLHIPSCRNGVPNHEMVRLYCEISDSYRKKFVDFMERWDSSY